MVERKAVEMAALLVISKAASMVEKLDEKMVYWMVVLLVS